MDFQLKGKTALITGASMGIGRAIAHGLGAEGVQLAITARRGHLLEEVSAEVVARGGPKPVLIPEDFMLEGAPGSDAMRDDVNEMQAMLEDYMAFAKGGSGEEAKPTDVRAMMEEVRAGAMHFGKPIELRFRRRRKIPVPLRRHGFKRAIANLVSNAARYADTIVVTVTQDRHWLRIEVDDDGPGIPLEKREIVFRPFLRLDPSRNQDLPNTGLGLAIARDIARVHGGDIWLEESDMGGLKGVVRVPV